MAMSRLFSRARAMQSCIERYRLPARSRDSRRLEFASATGGTVLGWYGRSNHPRKPRFSLGSGPGGAVPCGGEAWPMAGVSSRQTQNMARDGLIRCMGKHLNDARETIAGPV